MSFFLKLVAIFGISFVIQEHLKLTNVEIIILVISGAFLIIGYDDDSKDEK